MGFDYFYEDAIKATELIRNSNYGEVFEQSLEVGKACHGNYTYHNVLFMKEGIATTNFEKACQGIQIMDVYQFLRKCMEKTDWNVDFGKAIISGYNDILKMSDQEYNILHCFLLYPEKFWKITNFYYNNKKSWISKRNIQKLTSLQQQSPLKANFLNELFSGEV